MMSSASRRRAAAVPVEMRDYSSPQNAAANYRRELESNPARVFSKTALSALNYMERAMPSAFSRFFSGGSSLSISDLSRALPALKVAFSSRQDYKSLRRLLRWWLKLADAVVRNDANNRSRAVRDFVSQLKSNVLPTVAQLLREAEAEGTSYSRNI